MELTINTYIQTKLTRGSKMKYKITVIPEDAEELKAIRQFMMEHSRMKGVN